MSKAADAFCKHLDSLVEDLKQLTPAALHDFDEKSIHKSRVATRRIKAAMDLLKPVLDTDRRKPFARLGRKLRHRLGPLRDLDVMIGHLEEIKSARLAPAVGWLRNQFEAQRLREREKSTQKPVTDKIVTRLGDWPALRQDVSTQAESIPKLLVESVHLQLDQFAENAERLQGDAHPLRISGKALRYTLELLKATGQKLPAKVFRTFKRMQDQLGLWHDYVVLAQRAMQASLDTELPLHNSAMQQNIAELVRYAMKSSQRRIDQFAAIWKEKGPELAATIREACPLTTPEPVTTPQTDPGPADSIQPPVPESVSPAPPPVV